MPPVGFEPTISADERPQTYALDLAATGTGMDCTYSNINPKRCNVTQFILTGNCFTCFGQSDKYQML